MQVCTEWTTQILKTGFRRKNLDPQINITKAKFKFFSSSLQPLCTVCKSITSKLTDNKKWKNIFLP